MKGKTAEISILLLIVLAAVFLRLKGLAFQSLWLDELINLYNSSPAVSLGQTIRFCREVEHTPPLFYILIWVWQRIWGTGEFSARLLPALFGVLGAGGIYYLGRELFSAKTGLAAAVITALLPFHIEYSQETRPYSLLFLTVVLSYLFLVRLLRRPEWKNVLLYWLFTVVLLYTHYYGLFVFAAQLFLIAVYLGTAAAPRRGALLKKLLPALVLIALAYLPWGSTLFRMVRIDSFWIKPPAPGFFLGFFRQYIGSEPYLSAVFGLLLIGYLLSGKGREGFAESRLLLASWIFIVLFIPYFRSFSHPPILIVRYSTAVLPVIILMAARGLTLLPDARFRYFLLGTVILVLLVNLFYTRGDYYRTVRKAQWRPAAEFIILHDPEGEYPVCGSELFEYYFSSIFGSPRLIQPPVRSRAEARSWYREVRAENVPGFWLLEAHIFADRAAYDFLERKLEKRKSIELRGAKAALYVVDRSSFSIDRRDWEGRSGNYLRIGGNNGRMIWEGSIYVPLYLPAGNVKIEITAGGTPSRGQWPIMEISLPRAGEPEPSAAVARFTVDSSEKKIYRFSTGIEQEGRYELRISFVNDDRADDEDRNLYLDGCLIEYQGD